MDATTDQEPPPTLSDRQEAFLTLIAEYGTTDLAAAEAVGVTRWSAWNWKKNAAFLERYKQARAISLAHLVKEAERRAMSGSDRLLEFLLCNYAPEKFSNKQKVEHTGEVTLAERLARARQRTAGTDDGSDLAG